MAAKLPSYLFYLLYIYSIYSQPASKFGLFLWDVLPSKIAFSFWILNFKKLTDTFIHFYQVKLIYGSFSRFLDPGKILTRWVPQKHKKTWVWDFAPEGGGSGVRDPLWGCLEGTGTVRRMNACSH